MSARSDLRAGDDAKVTGRRLPDNSDSRVWRECRAPRDIDPLHRRLHVAGASATSGKATGKRVVEDRRYAGSQAQTRRSLISSARTGRSKCLLDAGSD
jgi:hypothetical protein